MYPTDTVYYILSINATDIVGLPLPVGLLYIIGHFPMENNPRTTELARSPVVFRRNCQYSREKLSLQRQDIGCINLPVREPENRST